MTRTLRTVRAHTVDGAHQLVVVDDAGAEHIFTASVTGMEFIHALDVASAGITLGDDENMTRLSEIPQPRSPKFPTRERSSL